MALSEEMGEDYSAKEVQLLPVGEGERETLKLKAEASAFDSLERVYSLAKPYGVPIPDIHIRYMSSKWASSIPEKGRIWINVYFAKLPESCQDYILLRQLLQFVYPKQNGDFYKALGKAMPNWKEQEAVLNNIKLPQKKMIASSPKLY